MADIDRIVRMLKSSKKSSLNQEAAALIQAQAKIVEVLQEHHRLVNNDLKIKAAHIAELEKALEPLAFREEIKLTLENGAHSVKAIVIFEAEREAAIKLLNGEK